MILSCPHWNLWWSCVSSSCLVPSLGMCSLRVWQSQRSDMCIHGIIRMKKRGGQSLPGQGSPAFFTCLESRIIGMIVIVIANRARYSITISP